MYTADTVIIIFMRWQIELVFKHLKPIFGRDFYAKKKENVEAWFY